MRDRYGQALRHFTLFPTPSTAGVDALSQTYLEQDNCYAFPPFCLLPAVVKFIIEEKIRCSLVFPYFSPAPFWIPSITEYASDVVPIGYKGDKGVVLYPSKSGYRADKVGLPWDMLCARFTPRARPCNPFMFPKKPKLVTPVLLIGDSIVRFMEDRCNDTIVISVGGAKLLDSYMTLKSALGTQTVFLVLLHSGTNNINKPSSSLEEAIACARFVMDSIKSLQSIYRFAVVISSCLYLKDKTLLPRVRSLNAVMKAKCDSHDFRFISHENINVSDLRDNVHLNASGYNKFLENLQGYVGVQKH